MKDIRIDQDGELRCWNCGSKGFTEKRTFRSKALVGVGALMTKKKLKCQVCGEYNDTGNARPYQGPASRKYRKQYETEMKATPAGAAPAPAMTTQAPSGDDKLAKLERLASLQASGAISDEEYAAMKAEVLGPLRESDQEQSTAMELPSPPE
jgi:DNA-directed RNA polymerase subunit RPC12/RpoP